MFSSLAFSATTSNPSHFLFPDSLSLRVFLFLDVALVFHWFACSLWFFSWSTVFFLAPSFHFCSSSFAPLLSLSFLIVLLSFPSLFLLSEFSLSLSFSLSLYIYIYIPLSLSRRLRRRTNTDKQHNTTHKSNSPQPSLPPSPPNLHPTKSTSPPPTSIPPSLSPSLPPPSLTTLSAATSPPS